MASLLLLKSMLYASAVQKSKRHKKKKKLTQLSNKQTYKSPGEACRICNLDKGEISIFNNSLQINIAEEIERFSGIRITPDDKLPQYMCKNCLDLLNGCIMFREMCHRNNKPVIEIMVKKEYDKYDDDENDMDFDDVPLHRYPDNVLYCTYCSKLLNDMESYNKHLKLCTVKNPPMKVKTKDDFTKRTFLCDICGKTAASNANLLVHMSIHESVFPFKCEQCPYQGRTMDLLKVHKRSHLTEKPYKCAQCPKSTTTSSNLKKHMRHVHSTNRPYKCSYCDKGFTYQHDMKRHIKDIHLRQGTVECDVCFKKFNTRKILQGHRSKIHKIKGERHGRLPSYLQHKPQDDEHIEDYIDHPVPEAKMIN